MRKRLWRLAALCCAVVMMLASVPMAGADEATTVHDIYTAADLAQMAGKSGTWYLRNDLDLTSWGNWTPITFSGTFDGMGHTIKGVTVSGYEGDSAGFFDMLFGTVRNLNLIVDVRGHYTIDVQRNEKRNSYVGGLAGNMQQGIVERVSVSGQVRMSCNLESVGSGIDIGGIVGYGAGLISDCYSAADVTLTISGKGTLSSSYCGGLAGCANTIMNSYASGKVVLSGLTLSKAYEQGVYCNGFVGKADDVRRSYYCNLRNPSLSSGAAYLTEEAMKQQSSFANWDFSKVWGISPDINNGFPYLLAPEGAAPMDVTLDRETLSLKVGTSQMLQAVVLPIDAVNRHMDWYTSDASVADLTPVTDATSGEINPRRMITAKAPGVAVITAVTTDGQIQAACTVTVTDGKTDPPPPYRLNSITIQDAKGNALNAVPSGSFLATVSVTNTASEDRPIIMLASYTAEGQYTGLLYLTMKSPVGGTIEATLPVDNAGGNISRLKAFAVKSMDSLEIIGSPVSFPAE